MNMSVPYLKDTEVANRYRISRPTIWRWVKNGTFPKPVRLGEGSTRWRLADLEKWEQVRKSQEVA